MYTSYWQHQILLHLSTIPRSTSTRTVSVRSKGRPREASVSTTAMAGSWRGLQSKYGAAQSRRCWRRRTWLRACRLRRSKTAKLRLHVAVGQNTTTTDSLASLYCCTVYRVAGASTALSLLFMVDLGTYRVAGAHSIESGCCLWSISVRHCR